jgi:hypothetical protein
MLTVYVFQVLGRLQKAQRLLKQSKQKDYYKVLGVARDADAKTIKKALYAVLCFCRNQCVFTSRLAVKLL